MEKWLKDQLRRMILKREKLTAYFAPISEVWVKLDLLNSFELGNTS